MGVVDHVDAMREGALELLEWTLGALEGAGTCII